MRIVFKPPVAEAVKVVILKQERFVMEKTTGQKMEQPKPFTPGLSKAAVRQHAFEMFRDKLPDHPLTLEDWVLAEKDLVKSMQEEESA